MSKYLAKIFFFKATMIILQKKKKKKEEVKATYICLQGMLLTDGEWVWHARQNKFIIDLFCVIHCPFPFNNFP